MSRRLEIHGPSEVKNDARRHAKVLCQRKTFEKSMYRSPESTTMGRDFRSTVSKDADLYAFGATVYAVMLRQDFDKGIHNSGMKRFRELAKGHGSLSGVMSKLLHRRRRSKRRSRRKKRSPSNLLSSPDLKRNSSHGSVLESMSSLFGFGSNDNDLENADEVASPRIIRHRLSSSVSGLSHSSNKLSSMLGSEIVDNGTVQFHRFIGKCLRTDPSARPKSVRCLNLIGECIENWHFDAASKLTKLEQQLNSIAHQNKKHSAHGAKGLASIIKTSYAKTATIYKSAQSMKRSNSIFGDDYDDEGSEKNGDDEKEEEEEEKTPDGMSDIEQQPLNFKPLIPDDAFVPPPGLAPIQRVSMDSSKKTNTT